MKLTWKELDTIIKALEFYKLEIDIRKTMGMVMASGLHPELDMSIMKGHLDAAAIKEAGDPQVRTENIDMIKVMFIDLKRKAEKKNVVDEAEKIINPGGGRVGEMLHGKELNDGALGQDHPTWGLMPAYQYHPPTWKSKLPYWIKEVLIWSAVFFALYEFHEGVKIADKLLSPFADHAGRITKAERNIALNRSLMGLDSVSVEKLRKIQWENAREYRIYSELKSAKKRKKKNEKATRFYYGAPGRAKKRPGK